MVTAPKHFCFNGPTYDLRQLRPGDSCEFEHCFRVRLQFPFDSAWSYADVDLLPGRLYVMLSRRTLDSCPVAIILGPGLPLEEFWL